tara:strand:- start:1013 stop:1279 length:267 start_codon:yes stop_codon:yes gene_type:complete
MTFLQKAIELLTDSIEDEDFGFVQQALTMLKTGLGDKLSYTGEDEVLSICEELENLQIIEYDCMSDIIDRLSLILIESGLDNDYEIDI